MSGAYPDGCVATDLPGCGPDEYRTDEDAAYETFLAECDDGERCGLCQQRVKLEQTSALGIPLLHCPHCGCDSIDIRRDA